MFLYFLFDFSDPYVLKETVSYLIPMVVGFIFAVCRGQPRFSKTFLRKGFLVLWALDFAYLIYKLLLEYTSLINSSRVDARPIDIAVIAFVLVSFVLFSMVGHFFNVKKVLPWLCAVLFPFYMYLGFSYETWVDLREPATYIKDDLLLEESDYDYEILFESEFTQGDNVYHLSYYSKGDSVYSCYRYRKCAGITWRMAIPNRPDTTFSIEGTKLEPCEPQLVTEDNAAKFRRLKERIENYELEYTAITYLDDSWLGITLKDYRQKKSRVLGLSLFPDEFNPHAAEIAKISRSLNSVEPPQIPELDDECKERSWALDTLMHEYGQTHSDRGKYFIF